MNSRQTQRLEEFDYASHGAYFITICTQARGADWFGAISRDGMKLNAAGEMVLEVWNDLPKHYAGVQIDAFVVMPDHIHGIVILQPVDLENPTDVGAGPRARPGQADANARAGQTQGSAPTVSDTLSLPDVVQRFKSLTTHRYLQGVRESGWPAFTRRSSASAARARGRPGSAARGRRSASSRRRRSAGSSSRSRRGRRRRRASSGARRRA